MHACTLSFNKVIPFCLSFPQPNFKMATFKIPSLLLDFYELTVSSSIVFYDFAYLSMNNITFAVKMNKMRKNEFCKYDKWMAFRKNPHSTIEIWTIWNIANLSPPRHYTLKTGSKCQSRTKCMSDPLSNLESNGLLLWFFKNLSICWKKSW